MAVNYRTPYRGQSPFSSLARSTPPATLWLIAACAAGYLMQTFAWMTGGVPLYLQLNRLLGLSSDLFVRGFVFQAVTYLFLHGGFLHLFFNMFMLWMFGSEVERLWGTRRFLTYYAICGIGAALTTVVSSLFIGPSNTIGASGAVLGLLIAYGMCFPDRTILLNFLIPMRARHFVLLMVGMQVLMLFSHLGSGIAVFAHLGGMLFGYLYIKRAWRMGEFFAELRWKLRRRRFKVIDRDRGSGPYTFH